MTQQIKVALAVLCATAWLGWTAYGQEEAPGAGSEAGGTEAGSREAPALKAEQGGPVRISLAAGMAYTDNRDSTPEEESNFDFIVAPGFSSGLSQDTWMFDFNYTPSFRYRSDPSDVQNDYDILHDLSLNGNLTPNPEVTLRMREKFDYTDDPSVSKSGVTIRENRNYILNNIEGGLNWRFVRWSDLDVYARNMVKRYSEDDVSGDSDRDMTEVGAALGRQVARTVVVQLIGRMSTYGFDSTTSVDRDFGMYLLALRAEKKMSPTLRGSATLGYQSVSYDDSAMETDSMPYGELDLRGDLQRVLHLAAALTHGIREADVYPFASQEYDQFSAKLTYDANESVTLGLLGAYRLSQYDEGSAPSGAMASDYTMARSGDEKTFVAGVDASIKVGPKQTVSLSQVYEDVNSDVYWSFTKNTSRVMFSGSF